MFSSLYLTLNTLFKAIPTGFMVVLIILLPQSKVLAQAPVKRPGIGLVLSGGGSHGIAHLGVLKVMEEAGLET